MTCKQKLDELNAWLEEQGVEDRVTFSDPVSSSEVADAEKALGFKLPPSYVDFITQYGLFSISGNLTGRGSGNDTELFSPTEAIEETNHYREELAEFAEGSEDAKIINDALIFCADPLDEFFHLFVISSANTDGEMPTRSYNYQDPACSDDWYEGDGSFESTIDEIIETVRENALEG